MNMSNCVPAMHEGNKITWTNEMGPGVRVQTGGEMSGTSIRERSSIQSST